MGFFSQEYWSGLPLPPPRDLPDAGIEPPSPVSPALLVDSLSLSHWGSPNNKKKNEIMSFAATRMELEIITLNEVSQREKDKYHMTSFYM